MNKNEILKGLENQIIPYGKGKDSISFSNEGDMFNYFYKRFDYAFLDMYKIVFGAKSVIDKSNLDYECILLERLKEDSDFAASWNKCKKVLIS